MPESIRDIYSGATLSINSDGSINILDTQLTQKISYNSDNMAEFIGEAAPGTAETSAGWRIKKLIYVNNQATEILWANGNSNFVNKWSEKDSIVNYS